MLIGSRLILFSWRLSVRILLRKPDPTVFVAYNIGDAGSQSSSALALVKASNSSTCAKASATTVSAAP
jgi:hypothetical protein